MSTGNSHLAARTALGRLQPSVAYARCVLLREFSPKGSGCAAHMLTLLVHAGEEDLSGI